ncbi:MAG: SMC family ATPase [Chloroflexi bacterium]|nr:SMC family ATPase [Chloroflexota bacterium]
MIPIRLRVQNFLCYRDPGDLDFAGLHLACLVGENGHGKSALLDAITWALWGRARGRWGYELIHLGQSDMEVELEFELKQVRYRVIRRLQLRATRTGKSQVQTVLELQVCGADGTYRTLTENSLSETERKIKEILRLDYETFRNSAFIMQGHADEFTTKTPTERKQVLANILGLDLYDRLVERAKAKAKEAGEQRRVLDGELQAIQRDLELRPKYEAAYNQASQELAQARLQYEVAESNLHRLQQEQQQWADKEQERQRLQQQESRLQRQIQQNQQEIATYRQRIQRAEAILAREQEIEAGLARWQAAQAEDQRLAELAIQARRLEQLQNKLAAELSRRRASIERDQHNLEQRRRNLQDRLAEQSKLQSSLAGVQRELARLSTLVAEQAAMSAQEQTAREQIAALKVKQDAVHKEANDLKQKMSEIQEAAAAGIQVDCPLCRQPLAPADVQRLVQDYQADIETRRHSYRVASQESQAQQQQLKALQEHRSRLDTEVAQVQRLHGQEGQFQAQLAELDKAGDEIRQLEERACLLTEQLASGAVDPEVQARLLQVEAEIGALGYDPDAHATLRTEIGRLSTFQGEHANLQQARVQIAEDRQMLQGREEGLAEYNLQLAEIQGRLPDLLEAGVRYQEITRQVDQQRLLLRDQGTRRSQAEQSLGAAQQRLAHLEHQARERDRLVAAVQQVANEQGYYEDLVLAFGKRGIQAMIIESALPEIEEEANLLLRRMTDGRMSVRFETQRETRSGDISETLEIRISDELGTRDYEMYSGGEAFRVNFAIRIALSKLLAHRAGARLETLFVDEGFGSQDAQGRERLVEALTAIQEDFACVLVITHIEELKDLFPARIEVTKTAEGSVFQLT